MIIGTIISIISPLEKYLICLYIYQKSINERQPNNVKAIFVLWSFLWSVIEAANLAYIPITIFRLSYCIITIITLWMITKKDIDIVVSAFLFAFGSSYVLFTLASLVTGFTLALAINKDKYSYYISIGLNSPIFIISAVFDVALQFIFVYLFFKIRRFKLGLPFLKGKYAVIVALIIAIIIIIFIQLIVSQREGHISNLLSKLIVFSIMGLGIGIYIWIRLSMKIYQKKRVRQQNEEIYIRENMELRKELEYYKQLNESVRIANHKIMHRQAAVERSVLMLMDKIKKNGVLAEYSAELSISLVDIRKLSHEYQESIIISKRRLPSTNINAIDNLFELFAERFALNNIDFNLKINGSIVYMVENIIDQSKLETMIGDHLQDSFTAIMASTGAVRSVLVMLGEVDGYYELSIQDSGIPFAVDTLVRLGTERVTTNENGSGIGFMTTFATMKEYSASLTIMENPPGSCFTKKIIIRFKKDYKYNIMTYRPGEFPESKNFILNS